MASSQELQKSTENGAESDTWTFVGRQRGKKPRTHEEVQTPVDRYVTVAQLNADLANRLTSWKASSCRKTLLSILARLAPDGGWRITNAVAIALGSFTRDNLDLRKRSMFQLAAFLDIVSMVLARQDKDGLPERRLFVQDPVFTELDKEFLEGLGFQVLGSDPRSLDTMSEVGEQLGPHCLILEAFLDYTLPRLKALLNPALPLSIRTPMEPSQSWQLWHHDAMGPEATKLKEAFTADHDFFDFPHFEDDYTIFSGLCVFHKKEIDSDGDSGPEPPPDLAFDV